MPEEKPIVFVAGATGRAGRLIVQELIKRNFRVRAMIVRPFDPAQPEGLTEPDIELAEASFDSLASLREAIQGSDYLISAIGSTKPFSKKEFEKIDVDGNYKLALAAKACGVKQMVVISSIGAGNSKDALAWVWRILMGPALAAKTKLEEKIKATDLTHTIIRPGGYTQKRLSGDIAIGEGGRFSGLVQREQVARVCVDAISNPAMQNRTFEVVDSSKVPADMKRFVIHP